MNAIRQFFIGEELLRTVIRLGFLALLITWTLALMQPFGTILAWAIVLAVAINPVFVGLTKILGGRPKLAAGVITAGNLAILIGPATWLGIGAVEGIRDLAGQLTAGEFKIPSAPQSIKSWPLIGSQLYQLWDLGSSNIRSLLRQVAPYLKPFGATLLGLAGDAGLGAIKFLVSIAVAGVMLPHGQRLVAAVREFLTRIVPEQSEHFLELAGATIRAVSQGVIGVAVIQALLAGLGFKLAGIPIAGFLAFIVLLLSIVQVGAAIVMLPVIIWIWTDKDPVTAILLTLFLVIVGLLDNILKPLLMGRGLGTPTLVILAGVIGGTLTHGLIGLFIGPIILAVAWELMMAWINTGPVDTTSAQSDR